MVGWY